MSSGIKIGLINKICKFDQRYLENVDILIHIEEYDDISGLSLGEQDLVMAAREAAHNAYAPYSQFKVGAAVLLENGEIFPGNNQENAAYPDGLCAERVALFSANATRPGIPIRIIAVTALAKQGFLPDPVYPCGSCRQSLLESENRFQQPIRVLMCGEIHQGSSTT